jgi:hypothetical protein
MGLPKCWDYPACQRHGEDVAKNYDSCTEGNESPSARPATLERHASQHDVDYDSGQFSNQPWLSGRGQIEGEDQPDPARKQQCVHDMRQGAHPTRLKRGRALRHPVAAEHKSGKCEDNTGGMKRIEKGVVQEMPMEAVLV